MSHIFISYSRQDKDFVRRLQDSLTSLNKEVWVDWKDIPPTAEWLKEIEAGIEAADHVIFVLSPDFLASEMCKHELAYALECGKRLVPLIYREVSPEEVGPALSALNWASFRESDDFEQAFQLLAATLDTDLSYLHLSARLLVRARDWEKQQANSSLLLRGSELEAAEEWLTSGTNKEPRPTMLHMQFITTSRRIVYRDQRRTISFLSIGSAFMLLLFLASIFFGWRAQVEGQNAIIQKNQAIIRQAHLLATQVESALINHQPDLALLLSLKAIQTYDDDITRESQIEALEYSPRITRILHGHHPSNGNSLAQGNGSANGISGLVFSPDGQTLISAGANDGAIIRWDLTRGWERHPLTLAPFRHRYGILGIALSPDGKLLASVGLDGVWLWNARTGAQLAELEHDTDLVHFGINQFWPDGPLPIQFSPDGEKLVAIKCLSSPCTQSKILIWDTSSRKLVLPPIQETRTIQDIAFSPDGTMLALAECAHLVPNTAEICTQGQIELWNTATWKPLASPLLGHAGAVWSLTFSPNGTILASGGSDNTIYLWDVAKRKIDGPPLIGHSSPVTRLAFSPDGHTLASASQDKHIMLWDMETRSPLNYRIHSTGKDGLLEGHSAEILSLAFSPDGQQLVSGDADNTILVWQMDAHLPTFHSVDTPLSHRMLNAGELESVAFSPDGKTVATGSVYGFIAFWDITGKKPPSGSRIAQCKNYNWAPCAIVGLTYAAPNELVAAMADGSIYLLNSTTNTFLLDHPWKESFPCASTFCSESDVSTMALSHDGTLVATGGCARLPEKVTMDTGPAGSIEVNSNCSQGRIWLWDTLTGRVQHLDGLRDFVTGLAFSPDDRTLAAASEDQGVLLWNLDSGKPVGKPLAGLGSVAFRPDGKTLATYSMNDTAQIWNTQTSEAVAQYSTPGPVDTSQAFRSFTLRYNFLSGDRALAQLQFYPMNHGQVAFSPDGKLLAIGAWDHSISVWDTTTNKKAALVPVFYTPGQINALTFSPDGKQLVSIEDEGYAIVWNINPASWPKLACQIAAGNFTTQEQRRFALDDSHVCHDAPLDASIIEEDLNRLYTDTQDHPGDVEAQRARYDQITQEAIQTDDARLNAQVCRDGTLDQFATTVLKACDRALQLEPDNGIYHDSRGLARALSGNTMGAAADFTSFINWIQQNNLYSDQAYIKDRETWIQERNSWIRILLLGINPIDSKTLHALQSEQFSLFAPEQCYFNGYIACPTPLHASSSP